MSLNNPTPEKPSPAPFGRPSGAKIVSVATAASRVTLTIPTAPENLDLASVCADAVQAVSPDAPALAEIIQIRRIEYQSPVSSAVLVRVTSTADRVGVTT